MDLQTTIAIELREAQERTADLMQQLETMRGDNKKLTLANHTLDAQIENLERRLDSLEETICKGHTAFLETWRKIIGLAGDMKSTGSR